MNLFAEDFRAFWQQYPRKVARLAALKAYTKARKAGVTQQQLLEGIANYVAHKPAYADWCHPATWLNQGRWEDEFDTMGVMKLTSWERRGTASDWWEECKAEHAGTCRQRWDHEMKMKYEREA